MKGNLRLQLERKEAISYALSKAYRTPSEKDTSECKLIKILNKIQ